MNGKMRVPIDSPDLTMWGKITRVLESKGIDLVHFRTVRQACEALTREDTVFVLCENRLVDGTHEDLLIATKKAGVRTRIVVAPANSKRFDSATHSKAKELDAFDVLRECYGPADLEWVVICAIRDREKVRARAAWREQGRPFKSCLCCSSAPGLLPKMVFGFGTAPCSQEHYCWSWSPGFSGRARRTNRSLENIFSRTRRSLHDYGDSSKVFRV